ncbi:thioredoxin-like protein [Gonapodya prolifera JEL478]|uniref:Thioredoxin-like protein n=1 Tax=Gonapodya prolifera (strain JEL478) TaxID=1344416 RepID=A0A139A7X3_GONPJ|nr:thioredoxin-like protein [Gonapodya prolifera JEL478]|eukprot:KXS12778.1 thioredoxin-like protein [Gonapodya prolifera JEL478]
MAAPTIECLTLPDKRIDKIAQRIGAQVIYKPALITSSFRASPFESAEGPHGNKNRCLIRDLGRTAKRFGVQIGFHKRHPVESVPALKLLSSLDPNLRRTVTQLIFEAYFLQGLDIGSPSILQSLTSQSLQERLDIYDGVENPKWETALVSTTKEAESRGAPFAPSFWIADSRLPTGGRLFSGADRLYFVEGAVVSLNGPATALPTISLPRIRPGPLKSKRKLTFWFDFSRWDRNLKLNLSPTLLGILFKEIGTPVEPRKATTQQAIDWGDKDMADWVSYWSRLPYPDGKEHAVALKWIEGPLKVRYFLPRFDLKSIHLEGPLRKGKKHFPIRTPLPLRVVCLKKEWKLIDAIYKAAWANDLDISDPAVLKSVISSAGYDPNLVDQADSQDARDALKTNVARAVTAGVCGFPSYQIVDGEVLWGQDKLDQVCDIIL